MTTTKSFTDQNSFTKEELIDCGHGRLFGEGNAQLPVDNMLMLDRITHISTEGGNYGKGEIIAELDIDPSLWFFEFSNDSWKSMISTPRILTARIARSA